MKEALTTGPRALFEDANVRPLQEPDLPTLRTSIQEFLNASKPRDTILFYFSGHGALSDQRDGESLYFAPKGTARGNFPASSFKASELSDWLKTCEAAQKIVILDCCFAGGFKGKNSELADQLSGTGIVVIAAAGNLKARDGKDGSPFTKLLVRGINEAAEDRLTVQNLGEWVQRQAKESNLPNVQLKLDVSGPIFLSKAVISPTPLSPSPTPGVPLMTLTFTGQEVSAVLPDLTILESRTLSLAHSRAGGLGYPAIVEDLTRLAASESLCNDPHSRQILTRALTSSRNLAGQLLFEELFDEPLRAALVQQLRSNSAEPRLQLVLDLTKASPSWRGPVGSTCAWRRSTTASERVLAPRLSVLSWDDWASAWSC